MKSCGRLYLIFLLFIFSRSGAQTVACLYADSGLQHVAQYATYLEDTEGNLTLGQITSPAFQPRFKPTGKSAVSFNVTRSVFWVHFILTTKENAEWNIHTEPALTNDMRFYRKTANGWSISQSGLDYPFSKRELNFNSIIFPLHLKAGDTCEYYLRIRSCFPVTILARAGTAQHFWLKQYYDSIFTGIFMGIMLIMMLYNLFLYVTNRDRVYIWYVLYVLTSAIFISYTNGYISIFPDIFRRVFTFNHTTYP
ncbi:MAG TPA: 7TM-DISM domain-containing protein, partial [Bacteroidia bacterium]|nr:7TM-DISM domain-containing protein [Bacteroidia bacterium]